MNDFEPPSNGTITNDNAADAIALSAATLRERVMEVIVANGGATDEEIQKALNLPGNTQRPRRWELVNREMKVVDSGKKRVGDSGLKAIVWVAA